SPGFDPITWGGSFVEGSAWQYRFSVPHDVKGLADAYGGEAALADAIDAMLTAPPEFNVGSYGGEIHEMTEVALAAPGFGQYAHSNQPVHHVLWLSAQLGRPETTDHNVRRVLTEMY